jgi:hypothetical protein
MLCRVPEVSTRLIDQLLREGLAQNDAGESDTSGPTQYLFDWRQILDALELRNNAQNRNLVRRLNAYSFRHRKSTP